MEQRRSVEPYAKRYAETLIRVVRHVCSAAGAGFSQANLGEAGLRTQAMHEIKMNDTIEKLAVEPVPNTVPDSWQLDE